MPPLMPYKLLPLLLYGRHTWITRLPGGIVSVPVAAARVALRARRPETLRRALEWLQEAGLVDNAHWFGRYFVARIVPPYGTARIVDAVLHPDQTPGPGQVQADAGDGSQARPG